ncbi:MAG: ABC transporter ATP-binding protein [Chloroflexi bacterium]|nr:ABC transporter ATP-binding protein [Chloroflexota bacterium]MBU1661964.1 ABC transporter ATP-binding protein [Chloroflexota bacterium]
MIKFENVTKIYPGMSSPAVDDLSFTVPTGEICTIVGPSGCGKTTAMKMVNRLIDATGGAIYVLDERGDMSNVLEIDPIQLRRSIGYIIQQIGLFPHRTILENIGTVPQLLDWDKARIRRRAEELVTMMNMPVDFLDRYPHELSGGQRQRIGVARGMATDPPVMLMDEPFGAVDPINRNILQNEFLRLQQEVKKTILFVTHDIDEAIKMGDKICILNVGGFLEQFDSPANILAHPANEFVEDFVGADRALKRLNLVRVEEVMNTHPPLLQATQNVEQAVGFMAEQGIRFAYVVDADRTLKGYVRGRDLKGKTGWVDEFVEPAATTIPLTTSLKDALSEMLVVDYANVCVVDAQNRVRGLIDTNMIHEAVIESAAAAEGEEA